MNSAPGKVWRPEGSNVARHFLQTGLQREDTCGMPGSLAAEALGWDGHLWLGLEI